MDLYHLELDLSMARTDLGDCVHSVCYGDLFCT